MLPAALSAFEAMAPAAPAALQMLQQNVTWRTTWLGGFGGGEGQASQANQMMLMAQLAIVQSQLEQSVQPQHSCHQQQQLNLVQQLVQQLALQQLAQQQAAPQQLAPQQLAPQQLAQQQLAQQLLQLPLAAKLPHAAGAQTPVMPVPYPSMLQLAAMASQVQVPPQPRAEPPAQKSRKRGRRSETAYAATKRRETPSRASKGTKSSSSSSAPAPSSFKRPCKVARVTQLQAQLVKTTGAQVATPAAAAAAAEKVDNPFFATAMQALEQAQEVWKGKVPIDEALYETPVQSKPLVLSPKSEAAAPAAKPSQKPRVRSLDEDSDDETAAAVALTQVSAEPKRRRAPVLPTAIQVINKALNDITVDPVRKLQEVNRFEQLKKLQKEHEEVLRRAAEQQKQEQEAESATTEVKLKRLEQVQIPPSLL